MIGSQQVMANLAASTERVGLDPLTRRLHVLNAWLGDDLTSLESAIVGSVFGDNLAEASARYLLDRRGKRIRPLCVLLAARLGGRVLDADVRDIAVAAELVHAATLLHDDVIDLGDERRGAPAARMVFGNAASVLGGDHLLVTALQLVARTGHSQLLTGLLTVIAEMVDAEALQLERRGRFDPDRSVYLRVAKGKTAALFSWALQAGGALGGLSDAEQARLSKTGEALGLAFQLVDDVLDFDDSETGKTALADVREGKLTWPLIVGAERDPEILTLVRAGQDPTARLKAVGALADSRTFAADQIAVAERALMGLPDGAARAALVAVGRGLVERMA
ncbi:MAG: octaprenyl-diphosphate synthase [Myxococcota bacterium]|jgi:octaprenyl-diphosphate synthase